MDLLGLLIIIGVSIFSSVMKSNQAKQQHAERQKNNGQTIYGPEGGTTAT